MRFFLAALSLAVSSTPFLPVRADISPLSPVDESADLVLERADWSGFAPLSLEELLRHFAGVSIARRGGLGSPQYINVLGSITGQVQVVLDGIELNEVGQNWSRLFGIPVSHIERILLYRTSDPVRLEIWTRESKQDKPVTDVDVGRGDFTTRTRRVRFATPERPVQTIIHYEELLRAQQDFRVDQSVAARDDLGSYAGRGRWVDGLLVRPNEDKLRFRYFDFVDDSNGSYDSQTDRMHTRRTLAGVRWSSALAGRSLELDLTNISWGRSQQLQSVATNWTESRNSVAADVGVLQGERLQAQARLRASELASIDDPGASAQRTRARQWDAGLYVSTRQRLQWQFWAAYHDHQRQGESWSGRARLSWRGAVWKADAEVGRGVSFAGNREDLLPGTARRAIGRYTSAGVARTGQKIILGARAWAKDFDGRSSATQELFPLLGGGAQRLAGIVADGQWNGTGGFWLFGLGAQVSWVPWVEGDRGGLPELQTEIWARLARLDWFEGDLSVTAQATWHAETTRAFTDSTELGDYHVAGFDFNVRFLRRMVFFWHIDNAFDIRYETHPNVLMPQIRNQFGVQVLFFN